MMRHSLRRTHYKSAVLHPHGADESIRQFLDVSRLSAEYNHFQKILVTEICMQGGDDDGVGFVLQVG